MTSMAQSHPDLPSVHAPIANDAAHFRPGLPQRPAAPTSPVPYLKHYEANAVSPRFPSSESHHYVQSRLEPQRRVGEPVLLAWRASQHWQQSVESGHMRTSAENQHTHRNAVDVDVLLDQRQVTEALHTLMERMSVLDRPPAYHEEGRTEP